MTLVATEPINTERKSAKVAKIASTRAEADPTRNISNLTVVYYVFG